MAAVAPVAVLRAVPAEEAARGDFYALLARLLFAPPDAALLATLGAAEPIPADGDAAIAGAWRDLIAASSVMDADAAAEEHEALFAGIGKSAVSPYAGAYGGAHTGEPLRVRIQADLARVGLARPDAVTEPEDHFAGLFEAMRVLAAGGAGREPAALEEQRRFFVTHIEPGAARFFEALARAPQSNYYRTVAALGAAFIAVETQSFQLN
jgi:TorA maturation chaperone TorD